MDEAWAQMTAMAKPRRSSSQNSRGKCSSEQVKQRARHVMQDHEKSSQELKQIAQKADIELKTDLPEAKREMIQEITKKSGAEFDKAYMDHEVAAHRMAVAHFRMGGFIQEPRAEELC